MDERSRADKREGEPGDPARIWVEKRLAVEAGTGTADSVAGTVPGCRVRQYLVHLFVADAHWILEHRL